MAEESNAIAGFELGYVSSAVSLRTDDGIAIHIVNDNSFSGAAEVLIYKNTGAGAVTVADSGIVNLTPSWTWTLGFTAKDSGEYWVRIKVSTEAMVPQASFERVEGGIWKPFVLYKPGDFAVFSLTRKRLW